MATNGEIQIFKFVWKTSDPRSDGHAQERPYELQTIRYINVITNLTRDLANQQLQRRLVDTCGCDYDDQEIGSEDPIAQEGIEYVTYKWGISQC